MHLLTSGKIQDLPRSSMPTWYIVQVDKRFDPRYNFNMSPPCLRHPNRVEKLTDWIALGNDFCEASFNIIGHASRIANTAGVHRHVDDLLFHPG
jgi:hypothetical protein